MKTVTANDFRAMSAPFAMSVVSYDESSVEHFDTRGNCQMISEESWGLRANTAHGILYIEINSHGNGRTITARNELRDA